VADTRTTGYDATALVAAADASMYRVKRSRQGGRRYPGPRPGGALVQ
jgi:hypothetical protein